MTILVKVPRSEVEYVEVVERRMTFTASERFLLERAERLKKAHQTYVRIMSQFVKPTDKKKSNRVYRALRRENMRRHDLAASRGNWQMSRTS